MSAVIKLCAAVVRQQVGRDDAEAEGWRLLALAAREEIDELRATRDVAQAATVNAALIHADLVRERDEARAEVERLREEVESHRDAGGYAFRGGYIEDASGGRWWSAGLLSMREAEVEMLRGVGCREAKEGEPESGPCGACLRCAEERGAKWALDSVGWSHKDDRRSIAERVCRDARGSDGRSR